MFGAMKGAGMKMLMKQFLTPEYIQMAISALAAGMASWQKKENKKFVIIAELTDDEKSFVIKVFEKEPETKKLKPFKRFDHDNLDELQALIMDEDNQQNCMNHGNAGAE